MKTSDFAIQELMPFIKGDDFSPQRSGPELVELFNQFGARDVYDELGLPDIGKRNGQRPSRKEYVVKKLKEINGKPELRSLLTSVFNKLENKSRYIDRLNKILEPEKYHIELTEKDEIIIIGGIIDRMKTPNNEAHFKEIEEKILRELDKARVSIWVAVGWFTNERLFNKLIKKQEQGIEVQIIIFNDGINSKYGVDLLKINKHFSIRGKRGGIMHDKFCVIDNQTVITGSYNWTNNAEFKNDENVTIERDPEQATRYSEEFKRLIKTKE